MPLRHPNGARVARLDRSRALGSDGWMHFANLIIPFGLLAAATALAIALIFTHARAQRLDAERLAALQALADLQERVRPIVDIDAERQRVVAWIAAERGRLEGEQAAARAEQARRVAGWQQAVHGLQAQHQAKQAELAAAQAGVERAQAQLRLLDEQASFHEFGFYTPHYNFSSVDRYEIDIVRVPEAEEYRKTTAMVNAGQGPQFQLPATGTTPAPSRARVTA